MHNLQTAVQPLCAYMRAHFAALQQQIASMRGEIAEVLQAR